MSGSGQHCTEPGKRGCCRRRRCTAKLLIYMVSGISMDLARRLQ
jgi:hypothetical protein